MQVELQQPRGAEVALGALHSRTALLVGVAGRMRNKATKDLMEEPALNVHHDGVRGSDGARLTGLTLGPRELCVGVATTLDDLPQVQVGGTGQVGKMT